MSGPHTSQLASRHSGGVPVPTNGEQVPLVEFQTVTSHGHEAVSDGTIKTSVEYSAGVATLAPTTTADQKGLVYVPIHNPPSIIGGWALQDISVNFDSEKDATVNTVNIYYDGGEIVSLDSTSRKAFYYVFSKQEASSYAYPAPKGITVGLGLVFPVKDSKINLYSVTLLYRAT